MANGSYVMHENSHKEEEEEERNFYCYKIRDHTKIPIQTRLKISKKKANA
jgi:hypothetical protein